QVNQISKVALARKNLPWLQARMFWLIPHRQPSDCLFGIATDSPLHRDDSENLDLQGARQLSLRYPDLAKAPEVVRQQLRKDAERASTPVRREILLALRSTDPTFAREIILPLASKYDGKDRFYLEAIGIAVGHHD